jgi:hypothetical protein
VLELARNKTKVVMERNCRIGVSLQDSGIVTGVPSFLYGGVQSQGIGTIK